MRPGFVLCMLLLMTAPSWTGCVDRAPTDDPAEHPQTPPGDEREDIDCEAHAFDQRGSTSGGVAAIVSCEGRGEGSNDQGFPCEDPAGAELRFEVDLAGGQARVELVDDADASVASRAWSAGAQANGTIEVSEGRPGTWRLTADRSEGFDGSFRFEAWCPGSTAG